MSRVEVWDITNAEVGDALLRGGRQWLSDYAVCPECGRVGAFCEDTGYWYHVIALFEGVEGIPWICDLCQPDTKSWIIAPPADKLPHRVRHPWEAVG